MAVLSLAPLDPQGSHTDGRVVALDIVEVERLKPQRSVANARRQAEERTGTLSRVLVGVTAIGRRSDRLRAGQRQTDKPNCCENERLNGLLPVRIN